VREEVPRGRTEPDLSRFGWRPPVMFFDLQLSERVVLPLPKPIENR
jgi:hypothetical protein